MNINHLREYVELCYTLNFSKAATRLNTTQSTLSKHVVELEKECGAKLFARTTSSVKLTPAGRTLFEEALTVITVHDAALEKVSHIATNPPVVLCGTYRNPRLVELIEKAAAKFSQDSPLNVSFENMSCYPNLDPLIHQQADIATLILSHPRELEDEYLVAHLFSDPMMAIVSRHHALAGKPSLDVTDLDGQLLYEPTGTQSLGGIGIVSKLLAKYQAKPIKRPIFLDSMEEFPTVSVDNGLMIFQKSLLPTLESRSDIVAKKFAQKEASFPYYAVIRKDSRNQRAHQLFRQLQEASVE